jgi:hypothetical protein
MKLTRKEKLALMQSLNWDYKVSPKDMLAVVEGKKELAGGIFDIDRLFVRAIERMSWYNIVALFGIDAIKKLYTPKLSRRLRSREIRSEYDFVVSVLRGKPLPAARWGSKSCERLRNPFLPDRRYCH